MAVNLFLTTALLSITGSTVYALLKLLVVASGGRLSQNWRYRSVVAVALFFVLPLYKLWALVPIPRRTLPSIIAVGGDTGPAYLPSAPPAAAELPLQAGPSNGGTVDWTQVIEWAAALWLLVAAGLILWTVWRLLRYRRMFEQASSEVNDCLQQIAREAARLVGVTGEVRLLASPLAQSPMLVGFFRPTIVLPSEHLPDSDARFILAHELTHFRRGDLWKKFLVSMIQCIYWFNPIVHLLSRDFAYWLETSCDEEVVSSLDHAQRKEYGYLLINYAPASRHAGPRLYVSFTSCRYKLKRRISVMMKSNKKSRSLLGLILALALIVGCLATSALAASFTKDEGIPLENLPEGTGIVTTGKCPYGTIISFDDGIERTPFDPTPYIKMIEEGKIQPLSSDNLPEGVTSLSELHITDVDSCPSIDLSSPETDTPKNNCESGPQSADTVPGTLRSVNRSDQDKFSEEEWADILERVKTGEILFFETLEDEVAHWHNQ